MQGIGSFMIELETCIVSIGDEESLQLFQRFTEHVYFHLQHETTENVLEPRFCLTILIKV